MSSFLHFELNLVKFTEILRPKVNLGHVTCPEVVIKIAVVRRAGSKTSNTKVNRSCWIPNPS